MNTKRIFLNGEWRDADETIEIRSPYSGELIANVSSAGADQMEESVASAGSAAREMAKLARFEVARGLRRIAGGIDERKQEFAESICLEAAKPIGIARGEVARSIATFEWAAAEAERFAGEVVPVDTQPTGKAKTAWTLRLPRGVIYGITPFNFPLNLVAHKVAPALAAKNAIIIKPSPRTPLTALLLAEVFEQSGLPKAALQVVPMDTRFIDLVLADDRIQMISFTGSADVGWKLKNSCGKKAVALELGGNAPVIVDQSADLETSVSRASFGAFVYAGQVCISVQRICVHESIFDEWTESFVGKAVSLRKGDPLKESTQLSVMIDESAAERALDWVSEALDNGARRLCGGTRDGAMFDATVLTGTNPEMRVVSEEVFAPVAVVEKFSDFSDAVEMANLGKYGLQAGVFTRDLSNMQYAVENLDYGGILINDVPTFRVDNMPYGGIKESGFGREGLKYAMDEMSETRLVVLNS